jgi:hypothetical protein
MSYKQGKHHKNFQSLELEYGQEELRYLKLQVANYKNREVLQKLIHERHGERQYLR